MLLTQSQFDEKIKNNELHIAFIGMSNIGKSHWTKALVQEKGFSHFSVDPHIEKELGFESMEAASKWMGYPFEEKYKSREAEYLKLEEKYTQDITIPAGKNFVLDTTGSVIHLNDHIHKKLKENYLIIEFDVSVDMLTDMVKEFFVTPKTVVWGSSFSREDDESGMDALRRCYPELLKHRIEKYRALGDLFIPGEFSRIKGLPFSRFWEVIRLSLPKS